MQRRHFLLGAAAALRGFAQDEAQPVRAGFIGTGNRGMYLLRAFMNLPGTRVTALCDIKADRLDGAATAAAEHKPATFADYRRLLEHPELDAVFIATPCDLHAEQAIAALRAGKHVYLEKPVGITPGQIRDLLAAARSARTVLQVGQQLRSDERLRATIARIQEGVAGEVIMVKAQRHASEDLDHHGPSADWFFDARRSGDVIVEMAVHNLDICNWIIGSRPERAAGFGGVLLWKDDPPGRTNMDGYTLSYEYANGVKLSFTQVFFHPPGLPGGGQYYYVYGTKGAVDVLASVLYPRERKAAPQKLVENVPQRKGDAHVAAFLNAIRTGAPPAADIAVGATAALTAILGREAIYGRRVAEWREFEVDL
ncbi:MAG: Gfo/Idh/MocA family oxidoreductase [Bryobacterales bacterium]|nr:Gfo/Idh/MocA family oxidoreductase [Bryobacteraceae bacterium]MDW8130878.1 Gfo/Idh/MocA family oxidoreductase [Bryobacterales bacterium]